jgi:hypothetical protein
MRNRYMLQGTYFYKITFILHKYITSLKQEDVKRLIQLSF